MNNYKLFIGESLTSSLNELSIEKENNGIVSNFLHALNDIFNELNVLKTELS